MAISKVLGATATNTAPTVSGTPSSVRRLEQALNSGNVDQAKLAFDTVKRTLSLGQSSAKDLTSAVTNLSQAINAGDLSKANEALAGVKEEAKKVGLLSPQGTTTQSVSLGTVRSDSEKSAIAVAPGTLDIKA
jgi:ribosomal protein S20